LGVGAFSMLECSKHVYTTYVVIIKSKDTCGIAKEGRDVRGEGLGS
jgi:hypothetical protein